MQGHRPDPGVEAIAQRAQPDALSRKEVQSSGAAAYQTKLPIGKVLQAQRIESQGSLLSNHLATQCVKRQCLTPVYHANCVYTARSTCWTALDTEDVAVGTTRPINASLLLAQLVPNGYDAIGQAQDQVLPVVCPGAAIHAGGNFVLLYRLLIRRPEGKVRQGAGGQVVRDGIEAHALNGVAMTVEKSVF